jgi:hypothetical protein
MVSSIQGFTLSSLSSIQSEISYADTDTLGNITDDSQKSLSVDSQNAVDDFGDNKNVLTKKISDMISSLGNKKQTSKETSPNMDLSLDDIPEPPQAK